DQTSTLRTAPSESTVIVNAPPSVASAVAKMSTVSGTESVSSVTSSYSTTPAMSVPASIEPNDRPAHRYRHRSFVASHDTDRVPTVARAYPTAIVSADTRSLTTTSSTSNT